MSATIQTLAALDNAAARFHDAPSFETAKAYDHLAALYSRLGLIDPEEYVNIITLVLSWNGA